MKKIFSAKVLLLLSTVLCFSQNQTKAPEAGVYKGFSSSSSIKLPSAFKAKGLPDTKL